MDIVSFTYWGFTSYLEGGSERYEFSNADHQTITWMNTEIVTSGNILRSFCIIMGIARKLQSQQVCWCIEAYLGLKTELSEYENEIW